MLNAYRRSPLTGWTSVIAVPRALLNAPLFLYIAYVSVGSAGVLLLTLGLASVQAARIAEPVQNLSQGATALVEGRKFSEAKHRISNWPGPPDYGRATPSLRQSTPAPFSS